MKKVVTIYDKQLECMCGCGTKLFLGRGDDGKMHFSMQEQGKHVRTEVVIFDDIPTVIQFVKTWK